ncbi:hypothetical protein KM043_009178 [Ampulex compressa]|nr:hypothetical protein KM043_009178 [Ampulex compressa]
MYNTSFLTNDHQGAQGLYIPKDKPRPRIRIGISKNSSFRSKSTPCTLEAAKGSSGLAELASSGAQWTATCASRLVNRCERKGKILALSQARMAPSLFLPAPHSSAWQLPPPAAEFA